jgi:hypothetical protein
VAGVDLVHGGLAWRLAGDQTLDAEVVAHRQVEIGPVRRNVPQRLGVKIRGEHLARAIGVRVALEGEGEGAAGAALRVDSLYKQTDSCPTSGAARVLTLIGSINQLQILSVLFAMFENMIKKLFLKRPL